MTSVHEISSHLVAKVQVSQMGVEVRMVAQTNESDGVIIVAKP